TTACCFFFNDTATTEIYTLSLHDALPISRTSRPWEGAIVMATAPGDIADRDRKSTRLNSSHANISYAVFCLKKKKCAQPTRPPLTSTALSMTGTEPPPSA